MCNICCSYTLPSIPVNASFRLVAAQAEEKQAQAFLEHHGFSGLKFKRSEEDLISFTYKDVDTQVLTKNFGPMTHNSAGSVSGKFGKAGSLAFWPAKKRVTLRNSKKGGRDSLVPPGKLPVPVPVPKDPVKTGTENDDGNVPVTKISTLLEEQYRQAQANPAKHKAFLVNAWRELNATKFGNSLRIPGLGFLKKQGAGKMGLRGVWYPLTRDLKVSPRLFNAKQNFFIEVLLHEMCHQAVYDLSNMTLEERADNKKHKGHGRVWAAWMRKVGLNPLRYDPNENTVYMTEEEKVEEQQRKDAWQKSKKDAEEQQLRPARMLYGNQVIVRRLGGLEKGIVVGTTGKTTKRWAILPLKTVERGQSPNFRFTWFLNFADGVYADPEGKNWTGDPKFEALGQAVLRNYQRKSERRQMNKRFKYG